MKIDLHVHCAPVSGCASIRPEELAEHYKSAGFDGFVLTNHINFWNVEGKNGGPLDLGEQQELYISTYERARDAGKKIGLTVIFGAELRLNHPDNGFEYLLYGLSYECFHEMYPGIEWSQKQLFEFCQKNDIVLSQAHPMRYNNGEDTPDRAMLNAIEIYNPGPGRTADLETTGAANWITAKKYDLLPTAGTDLHHIDLHPHCGIITKTDVHDQFELRDILKKREYEVFHDQYEGGNE